jgi:MFS transporter, NNP family, nitrate/nitrite transporter
LMNIFARTLGGYCSDRVARVWGLSGRVKLLFALILAEGLSLVLFSRIGLLAAAVAAMLVFSLFVQMSEGATFGVVPFVNRRALGAVSGIVGAGGNAGAVAAGFLFGVEGLSMQQALLYMGIAVAVASGGALIVRFAGAEEAAVDRLHPALAGQGTQLAGGLAEA